MQIFEAYEILEWDGGERHTFKMLVKSEEEAKKWKAKHKYDLYYKKQFVIYDTIEEASETHKQEIKEKAMQKLTDEEKQALGLL